MATPYSYLGCGETMNLQTYGLIFGLTALGFWGYGLLQYKEGYADGRAKLIAEQNQKAQEKLAKQVQRQQTNDIRAAAADEVGKAKTITITQEVIKYVKTPGRTTCVFPDDRLRIKADAAANANNLTGFDDTPVQDGRPVR